MPYLTPERRGMLDAGDSAKNAGDLNYLISQLANKYWVNSNRRYQDLNDIVGAMEGAKAEFIRQVVNPYEDSKIEANGGLYNVK